jgi:UDP-N-acetylglucosamine 1-carboxyvinyltransferase
MAKICMERARHLNGNVKVSGSKNSVLPLIAAALLTNQTCRIKQVPYLYDVKIMCDLIKILGGEYRIEELDGDLALTMDLNHVEGLTAPYELAGKMRASFLIMGPLLSRFGCARIPLPGGCAIGSRPIDLHLKGFAAMGASIHQEHGFVESKISGRLKGARIYLDFPSVGATENIMMAAVLANGETLIENAATEPEIVDLATCLNKMGANIKTAGTDTIRIEGVDTLTGMDHTVIPDRIETGTFMVATCAVGGDVRLQNVVPDHLKPVSAKLKESGAQIWEEEDSIRIVSEKRPKALDLKTLPYPGFPTDMQAQMGSLLTVAKGTSVIIETIFENRFMHLNELMRMGANVKIEGRSAVVEGVEKLTGTNVRATDLRAGASLIIAGLVAEGQTQISDVEHIDRGYENIVDKFKNLGANIWREDEEEEE